MIHSEIFPTTRTDLPRHAVHFCSRQIMQVSNQVPNVVANRTKPKHSSFGAELEKYSDFHVNVIMHKQIKMQSLTFSFKIKTLENHMCPLVNFSGSRSLLVGNRHR